MLQLPSNVQYADLHLFHYFRLSNDIFSPNRGTYALLINFENSILKPFERPLEIRKRREQLRGDSRRHDEALHRRIQSEAGPRNCHDSRGKIRAGQAFKMLPKVYLFKARDARRRGQN